jgi:hypothetical protein
MMHLKIQALPVFTDMFTFHLFLAYTWTDELVSGPEAL